MVYLELVDEEYVATQRAERTPAPAAEPPVPVEAADEAPETEAEAVEDPEAAAEVEATDEVEATTDDVEPAAEVEAEGERARSRGRARGVGTEPGSVR